MPYTDQSRPRRRTVNTTEVRSLQLAIASAYFDTSGEMLCQAFILTGLILMARHDQTLARMLARVTGMDWDQLEHSEVDDIVRYLIK